jgi:polygalacturonase
MTQAFVFTLIAAVLAGTLAAAADMPGNVKDPQAVQAVLSGDRTVANAAWWGFNDEDSTDALQAAINSGAKRVIVPNMGKDWIVRPLRLAGEQELVLERGVVITARHGQYRGTGDCVLTAEGISNLTISGYGATVRMQKEDYIVGKVLEDMGSHGWFDQYKKGEWRHPLQILGCTNVKVLGVTLRDSGGDGIYVSGSGNQPYSKDVHIKDVVCDNNYRQGISIIGVDGLVVENCVFQNTWGTPPSAGVDLEPNRSNEVLRNIVFRNCRFTDNYGDGIQFYLANLTTESGDISVRFENCHVTSKRGAGISVIAVRGNGPGGLIEFRDCVVDGTLGTGIMIADKSAERARVRFVNCTVRNAAGNRDYHSIWAPIGFMWLDAAKTPKLGGVDFVDCVVEDDFDRPVTAAAGRVTDLGLFDITGVITASNPHGVKSGLPAKQTDVTLVIREGRKSGRAAPPSQH